MPIPYPFDFKNPDYAFANAMRLRHLKNIRDLERKDPGYIYVMKEYYKKKPAQFIIDWGVTFDPRNASRKLPSLIPFLLSPKQEEWVEWAVDAINKGESALTDKSRDMGVTWLFVALADTLCLLNEGMVFGVGSRKEEYVDKLGSPKCILYKARQFIRHLPPEFRGSWVEKRDAPFKTIRFPDTGSIITGESGDGIGRGDRATAYFVDEAAFLSHPETVDASLSQTTNSVFWISTPNGRTNPFARKRFSGAIRVMSLHWSDDPRKDQAWYDETCKRIDDPLIIAQEIDLDYDQSVEGVVIPAMWVEASIDAHIKLGIKKTGPRTLGLDVADQGRDINTVVGKQGFVIDYVDGWSGKDSDIFKTTERAITLADTLDYMQIRYDSDGLGAGVRGDAEQINNRRKSEGASIIECIAYRGSGAVVNPEDEVFPPSQEDYDENTKGRTNEDFFANMKAQAWWHARKCFRNTYRAVNGLEYDPDLLISISSCQNYRKLTTELSQPTFSQRTDGKIIIDKMPDGALSPNYADACIIVMAPTEQIPVGFF